MTSEVMISSRALGQSELWPALVLWIGHRRDSRVGHWVGVGVAGRGCSIEGGVAGCVVGHRVGVVVAIGGHGHIDHLVHCCRQHPDLSC